MKYIVTWNIKPENYKEAVEIFLQNGAQAPDGVTILGRWHALGSNHGWVLVEGDETGIATHIAEWSNLLELSITPVFDDEQAAASLSKVYGN
ncbi:MAG TPA: DUF3303 family protein [Thermodesulfobacteriota bacterium]|nr:DUF3303 family protein [Thermodesulfobacteriota bacterium]